jgi:hypothetical protein
MENWHLELQHCAPPLLDLGLRYIPDRNRHGSETSLPVNFELFQCLVFGSGALHLSISFP